MTRSASASERTTAFYKAVKFWLLLLLALVVAAALWRLWAAGDREPLAPGQGRYDPAGGAPPFVSYIR